MTVFINKGDKPLSIRQATNRGLRYFDSQLRQFEREAGIVTDDEGYLDWSNQWLQDNITNGVNNQFNHSLFNYNQATKRLARYKLEDGREEVVVTEVNEFGDEVEVVISPAIEPLTKKVEEVYYEDEVRKVREVLNPLIVADRSERASAEQVIQDTPQEVKDFKED